MTKFNQSFKQQVSGFYLQYGKNRSLTRQHFQLAEQTLNRWIKQFNHNGNNRLEVRDKKQTYSPEFKLSVVQAVNKENVLQNLLVCIANSGIISQWLQAFERQGINGLMPKPKGRPSMKPQYPKMPPKPKTED